MVSKGLAKHGKKLNKESVARLNARAAAADPEDKTSIILKSWQRDAHKFVVECLGIDGSDGKSVTPQQRDALDNISRLCVLKRRVFDYDRKIGRFVDPEVYRSTSISDEDRDFSTKIGISIMSGKGCGKDGFASWVVLWFLCTTYRPKILCTAPTEDQLKKVLWDEVALWHGRKRADGTDCFQLRDRIVIESEKIFMKGIGGTNSKDGLGWSAFMRCPQHNVDKSKLAATVSGYHADNMLIIADEADGLEDAVFEPLENTMTQRVNLALLLFNPRRRTGFAHGTHYGTHKSQWVRLQWNGEDSPLVKKDIIENMRSKYGVEHDNYVVNVLGLPPKGGSDALIPFDTIEIACQRESIIEPGTPFDIGLDLALSGSDRSIMCIRQGQKVHELVNVSHNNVPDIVDNVYEVVQAWRARRASIRSINVEKDGINYAIYQELLSRMGALVRGVAVGGSANQVNSSAVTKRYLNNRAKLYDRLRNKFRDGLIQIPDDDELKEELMSLKSKESENGLMQIISKKDLRKTLNRSPDKADALMLSFNVDDITPHIGRHDARTHYQRSRFTPIKHDDGDSWMTA